MTQQIYIPPTLVVDAVIFQIIDNNLCVLLIQREHEPFQNAWALPGGYIPVGETTLQAFDRILLAKCGLAERDLQLVEQLCTTDAIARDPRGHAVTVSYMGLCRNVLPQQTSTTQHPTFTPVTALPALAFDHEEIITYALERLRSKITYTAAIAALVPVKFSLTQLQVAHELVLGRQLDKRNFRKKFLSFDVIKPTEDTVKAATHRPARLYKFTVNAKQPLEQNFS